MPPGWIVFAVRNICYGLNGKEAMLAHCWGKQARNQEVAGGLTKPTWCRFLPHEYVESGNIHAPGLIGHHSGTEGLMKMLE